MPENGLRKHELAIINLDHEDGPGTHWVAYKKPDNNIDYFDSFGNLQPPSDLIKYLGVGSVEYEHERYRDCDTFECGHLCPKFLTATVNTQLVNNAICHPFEEIRYEINAVQIDRRKNVGLTSLIKGYASLHLGQTRLMENTGWLDVEKKKKLTDAEGNFDVLIPLSMILRFAKDYPKIVVNELILTRSKTNVNAIMQTQEEEFKITINTMKWLIPYLKLADQKKVDLLNFIQRGPPISMSFRSWEVYEYPLLTTTSKHVWTVKTSIPLEEPRYVILGFQTSRKNKTGKNASHFDHCNITDVKLSSNS
ncbi:uncharacterized protein [Neodiprion pinetum]|uniref:uncharacterized protein n=1 Tax=Neodiprion pinetum TaxID=441929 RepID=UPI00371EFA51